MMHVPEIEVEEPSLATERTEILLPKKQASKCETDEPILTSPRTDDVPESNEFPKMLNFEPKLPDRLTLNEPPISSDASIENDPETQEDDIMDTPLRNGV
jgi:hypothetical protein